MHDEFVELYVKVGGFFSERLCAACFCVFESIADRRISQVTWDIGFF